MLSQLESSYERILCTCTLEELARLIREMRDAYGLAHLVYHAVRLPGTVDPNPILLLTYEPEWIRRYVERDYFRIDPVVANGRMGVLPLDWADVDRGSRQTSRFFRDAESYGVGRQGLSIPIRGPGGERALLSISSNASMANWRASRLEFMREFQFIAPFLHDQAVRIAGLRSPGVRRRLSPRESEALQLTAYGFAPKQIAAVLQMSPTAVRLHLQNARLKLECATLCQAIAKAVSLEVIHC